MAPSSAPSDADQPLDILHDDLLFELLCDLLDQGREASFIARGSSMHPVIRDGDQVTIAPARPEEIPVGCVALYLSELPSGENGIVIHRVQQKDADGRFIFRGDACPLPDPPVDADRVIGRVVEVRHGERVVRTSDWAGRRLLEGGASIPRLMAHLSRLRSRLRHGPEIPYLPVTHGRLLRERGVIGLCLGDINVLEELAEYQALVRLPPEEYGLLPMMLYRLREDGIVPDGLLPPEAEALELGAVAQSARMEAALTWLDKILTEAGEELLLVKGAGLAWTAYPEPHLRPVADIDVLARQGREAAVVEVLLKAGAAMAEPEHSLPYYLRFKNEVALRLPGSRWPVLEVHWRGPGRPCYNRRGHVERFWFASQPSEFGGRLRVLSAEAELVYGVAHLAKHLPHLRMVWAMDMALLAERDLDWDCVANWLIGDGLALPAAVIFRWLEDHVPGVVPEGLTGRLADYARPRAGRIERTLLMRRHGWLARLAEAWCQPAGRTRRAFVLHELLPERRILERMFPGPVDRPLWSLHLRRLLRLVWGA